MRTVISSTTLTRISESEQEDERLLHEAKVLQALAHPGVVALSCPPGSEGARIRLATRVVPGPSLARLGPQPCEATVGWAAAALTTLADVHDLGYAHRDLSAEHIVFDEIGRPVLSGFGRATAPGVTTGEDQSGDVARLSSLALERLGQDGDRRVRAVLAVGARARGRGRAPSARSLARELVRRCPSALLPDPTCPLPADPAAPAIRPPARWRRVPARAALITASVVCAGALALVLVGRGATGHTAHVLPIAGGKAQGRYELQIPPGERILSVTGRWGCGPALPAALDVRTGWVWAFASWPAVGSAAEGRPVIRIPDATGLAVRASRGGCDRLLALRRSGSPEVVAIGRRP